jgi:hypothetical protein
VEKRGKKEAAKYRRGSEGTKPGFHGWEVSSLGSMLKKRKFMQEFISTTINGGIGVIENPVIPSRPNTPGHKDNDFHEEGSSKMSSY